MEKRGLRWIPLVLLAAWSHVTQCDLYHHMEDAFADDTVDKGTTCRRNEKTTVCRLGNLQKPALHQLEPCLCTHLIFPEGSGAIPQWLRKKNPDLHLLVSVSLGTVLKSEAAVQTLVESIQKEGFDGLDLTIDGETSKSLDLIRELTKQLASVDSPKKLLHLTFVNYSPPASFVTGLLKETDVASFTFFADFKKKRSENLMLMEEISKLGIPRNKTLYGISLGEVSYEPRPFQHQRCSEISPESVDEEVSSSRGEDSQVQKLRDMVDYAKRNADKSAGIDVWSLSYDDAEGICGQGPFPVLHYISQAVNQDPQLFDEFADLDIVLSTGESQELQFLEDVEVTPEEMKKLPCDRIGFYRHPSDCSKFYHCSEYRATKFNHSGPYAGFMYKCPNGLVYDERQGSCIWASLSDPCAGSGELLPVPAKKFSCVVPGFHVDPENCRWFYYCSDLGDGRLEAFEFLCPSDLLGYDEEKMLCNWKWTVPACLNNDTQPGANAESVTTPKVQLPEKKMRPQSRTSKELNTEDIQELYTPSSRTTRKPRRIRLISRKRQRNSNRNEATLVDTDTHTSPLNNLQQLVTTEISMTAADFKEHIAKETNNSTSQQGFTNERHNLPLREYFTSSPSNSQKFVTTESSRATTDTTEDVELVNNVSPQQRFTNERQNLPERKYGTAVWRRSWLNDRTQNPRTVTSQISTSYGISRNDRINKSKLNDIENNQHSNRHDLEINISDKRVPSFESENEPERFFKGVVRKINNDGTLDQSFDLRHRDEKNTEREILTTVRNSQHSRSRVHDQRDSKDENTFYNIPDRELNADVETVSIQGQPKSNPFLNVRCSKLQNGNDQLEETGTLGCTSEVSLTIQIRKGKDPSKYILKDDKITRTALQESQRVSYIQSPLETKANNLSSDTNRILQRTDSPTWLILGVSNSNRNETSFPPEKMRSPDTFTITDASSKTSKEAENTHVTNLKGSSDIPTPHHLPASSLTKTQGRYDVRASNIYDNQHHNTSAKFMHRSAKFIDDNGTKINQANDETKKSSDDIKSLPIHFYPQGVLLNIDITHMNQIPPQILLEVDNMLKTYMNEGNIDLNLLERKLNASTESMAGKENENMEPEEIMDMIKMIENIINTSREREMVSTETYPSHSDTDSSTINQTETYSGTVTASNRDIEYENISSSIRNISDKYFVSNDTGYGLSEDNNGQNIQLMNDKIQTSEVLPNNSETARGNPFDRRRLLRKFKYPSIREQLERQNKFRNTLEASHQSPRSETFSLTNRSDIIVNTSLKRDETISDSERITDKQNASIQTMSPKTHESTSQPLVQQYGGHRITSNEGKLWQENYRHFSADRALPNDAGYRPPSAQYENSQTWENSRTSREDINLYPSPNPVYIPVIASENEKIGNPEPLVTNIRNSEFRSFQYDTYGHLTDSQAILQNFRNDRASQPSPPHYDSQPQSWENQRTSQYDTHLYASLNPIPVTASYGENVKYSRPVDAKGIGNVEIRTFHAETYEHFPVGQVLQGNNAQRPPPLQYGDRTKVSENRTIHDEKYVHSSFKATSSHYPGEISGVSNNAGRLQQNSGRLETENDSFNLQRGLSKISNFERENHFAYNHEAKLDVTSDAQVHNFHNAKSDNLPFLSTQDASHQYRESGPSAQTNRIQTENSQYANLRRQNLGTKADQTRKKRKLRILVRKLSNSASVPQQETLPMSTENSDLQKKISKNVLNALKSRILQKHAKDVTDDIQLQIHFQGHVWNTPFVNGEGETSLSPAVCTRPGLFQHPRDCSMFYECFWDKWLQRFTLHVFSCPVKLVYDESLRGCNRPSAESPCKDFAR